MTVRRASVIAAVSLALVSIQGCASADEPTQEVETTLTSASLPPLARDDMSAFVTLSERRLNADGVGRGRGAYELIRAFGGRRPIEAPDLYAVNHPGVAHIYEDTDTVVGDHFVFTIHRDEDIDRDREHITDRQRNEIKTYRSSEDTVKGFKDETLIFTWKFKINADMTVSKRFTHLFQLKAVGGNDSQPIITITGSERRGSDGVEVRHSPSKGGTVLARQDWGQVTGEWLQAYCRATFADDGSFRLILTRLSDGAVVFDINLAALDLWRGANADDFVRPKWGIYRSILDLDNLRSDEEVVRFADFRILKVARSN